MDWSSSLTGTGYSGDTGTPVTPTSNGNEAIFVNVASGEITINVATGATTPTIKSAGAIVNVAAGLATLEITNLRANTEVRIYKSSDNSELSGTENATTTDTYDATNNIQYYKHTYSYAGGSLGGTSVYIVVFNTDYWDIKLDYTLKASNDSILIQQVYDRVSIV